MTSRFKRTTLALLLGMTLANSVDAPVTQAATPAQPPLLITEVVPDTTNVNSLDGYEFIEIFNNSDQDINFKDYKIRYRYPMDGPEADLIWPGSKEDIVIPSGETLVFWIINKGNTTKTVADFNTLFKTNLTEDVNLVKIYSDGMANGSHRGIVIATNTGQEIATSEYNNDPTVKDVAANKGIVYSYPTDGSIAMKKISSATLAATPGSITLEQVPTERVTLPQDQAEPEFTDLTNLTSIDERGPLELLFDVKDDTSVKTVTLHYKTNTQDTYRSVALLENYDDKLYHHMVYLPELIGKDSLDYFVTYSDGIHDKTTETKTIDIVGGTESEALRLNVEEGTIVTGQTRITATSSPSGYDAIELLVNNRDVSLETYPALEEQAYFSFEVKKTNLFFKNGITMGEDILTVFDDTINNYVTMSVPIDPSRIERDAETVISIRSGTKVSPFDTTSEENRDDFYIKNVRLVLADGTAIYDPAYNEPEKELTVGDGGSATPTYNFAFQVPTEKFTAKAYTWDTTAVNEGPVKIAANEGGQSAEATVIVDNSAPSITPSLTDGDTYKGDFTIDALIEDTYSGVAEVTGSLDGKEIELPYDTSSAKLKAGDHTFTVTARDTVGNSAEQTLTFVTQEEHPVTPALLAPEQNSTLEGVDAQLKVEVTDPTNDELTVDFYEGHQYKPKDAEVRVVAHAADTEPPATLSSEGETPLTEEELEAITEVDGEFMTTSSEEQFPYHRFEVEIDENVTPEDTIELHWEGKSLPGRKVSMYVWNLETAKWELKQWKVAGEENFTLTSEIQGAEYLDGHKVHVLIQDELAPEASTDYTMIWMSDTQYYSESYPHIYKNMVDWIAAQKESLRIPYVFHTGDLVDVATDPQQWAYADEYMRVLESVNLPYGVLAGNHDVDHKTNDYTQYSTYFGEARFKDQPTYGESYKDNRGHYDLVSVNGNDYIMLYMGWGIGQEEIDWMNDVLERHPDRMAFLAFHEYMLVSGNRSPIGNDIYEQVVLPNENVVATLSGHYHDSETLIDEIDDDGDGTPDRKVYQMLADYQGGPEGGQGYMRLLQFNQADNTVYVKTYSPYLDDYNYYNPEEYPGKDEFAIELPLAPRTKEVSTDAFEVNVFTNKQIGETQQAVDNQAEVDWMDLTPETEHSWYVNVQDSFGGSTRSDVWSFTTGTELVDPEEPVDSSKWTLSEDDFVSTESGLIVTAGDDVATDALDITFPGNVVNWLKSQAKPLTVEVAGSRFTIPANSFKQATGEDLVLNWKVNLLPSEATFLTDVVSITFSDDQLNASAKHPYVLELPVNASFIPAVKSMQFGAQYNEASSRWQYAGGEQNGNLWTLKLKKLGSFAVLENAKTFTDIQAHWAKEPIEELASKLIVAGMTDKTFVPKKALTRAEFTVLLARMMQIEPSEYKGTFRDVSESQAWFATYVEAASERGIVFGYPDGTFRPNQHITRQEMVAILYRALDVEQPEALDQVTNVASFKDEATFNPRFMNMIYKTAEAGLIQGRPNGTFDPLATSTRAEASVLLREVLNK